MEVTEVLFLDLVDLLVCEAFGRRVGSARKGLFPLLLTPGLSPRRVERGPRAEARGSGE